MDFKDIPTIEIMNCQQILNSNMEYNKGILDMLTKTKGQLKGYDADNSRTDQLLKKLDSDYALLYDCQVELQRRCSKALNYPLETKKFDTLKLEVESKFSEAAAEYLQNTQNQATDSVKQKDGVVKLNAKGEA